MPVPAEQVRPRSAAARVRPAPVGSAAVTSLPDRRSAANPLVALADRPVLAAVLGALSIAFSAVLVRLSGASPATAAIFRCAYALPFLALIAWIERRAYGPRPAAQVRLAWLAGTFF